MNNIVIALATVIVYSAYRFGRFSAHMDQRKKDRASSDFRTMQDAIRRISMDDVVRVNKRSIESVQWHVTGVDTDGLIEVISPKMLTDEQLQSVILHTKEGLRHHEEKTKK